MGKQESRSLANTSGPVKLPVLPEGLLSPHTTVLPAIAFSENLLNLPPPYHRGRLKGAVNLFARFRRKALEHLGISLSSELVFLAAFVERSAVAKPLQSRLFDVPSKRSITRFAT